MHRHRWTLRPSLYPGARVGEVEFAPDLPIADPLECLAFVAASTTTILLGPWGVIASVTGVFQFILPSTSFWLGPRDFGAGVQIALRAATSG